MTEAATIQLVLLGLATFSANLSSMMWIGYVPAPPGRWFPAIIGGLVLLSVQCLAMMVVVDAMDREEP